MGKNAQRYKRFVDTYGKGIRNALTHGTPVYGALRGLYRNRKQIGRSKRSPNNIGNDQSFVSREIEKRLNRGTNFATDEGTFFYRDTPFSLSIANLSANKIETTKIKQLNASTICPVPTTSGQFIHKKSIYDIFLTGAQSVAQRFAKMFFFLVYPKGNWTPAESALGFEACIKAQNDSLFHVKMLKEVDIISKTMVLAGDVNRYIINKHFKLDLTDIMNQLQASVNKREGLINEIDAVPCWLGAALCATDNGDTYYIDAALTDVRELQSVPFKP